MAETPREPRRLQKEQAKAEKAAAKAARAAARKKSKGQAAEESPRIELVVQPGPVKHVHWGPEEPRLMLREAEPSPQTDPTGPPSAEAMPARPAPALMTRPGLLPLEPGRAPAAPVLVGRRKTLYTTEHGNQVVAYERGGQRQLALTERQGDRLQEIPFSEAQVDQAIDAATPTLDVVEEPEEPAPKRWGFWRKKNRKEAVDASAPVVEHIYRPVQLVDSMPVAETVTAPLMQAPKVAAWEPDGKVSRSGVRPRPAARRTKRAPARKARRATQPTRKPKAARRTSRSRKAKGVYSGHNHPVQDIEGIGPVYGQKLEEMRIPTTGLLNAAPPGRIAARLQVPTKTVRMWQSQAELLKIKGVGPQYAEAMARAGIRGIDELKQRTPDELSRQVSKYLSGLDANVVGQPVTAKRIATWKRKAKPMRRVKADPKKLAIADHGIPPPWLREASRTRRTNVGKPGKAGKKAVGGARKAKKAKNKKAKSAPGSTRRNRRVAGARKPALGRRVARKSRQRGA